MKLQSMYCPYCGGNIKVDFEDVQKSCFCIHCGQQIIIDDEVTKTEHKEILVDQAKIQKELVSLEKKKIEFEEKKREERFAIIAFFVFIGILALVIIFACLAPSQNI